MAHFVVAFSPIMPWFVTGFKSLLQVEYVILRDG